MGLFQGVAVTFYSLSGGNAAKQGSLLQSNTIEVDHDCPLQENPLRHISQGTKVVDVFILKITQLGQ